jgi:hypothetical protein
MSSQQIVYYGEDTQLRIKEFSLSKVLPLPSLKVCHGAGQHSILGSTCPSADTSQAHSSVYTRNSVAIRK